MSLSFRFLIDPIRPSTVGLDMDALPDFGREVDSDDDGKAGKQLVRDVDLDHEHMKCI